MSFSPLSTRLSRLGRFLFGGILALLVVDFGLRLIEVTPLWRILPVVQPILGQPDKDFGFESTPGGRGIWTTEHRARVQLNSLGLRDVERELAKPAGTFRIGLLGDSMVEAAQVGQQATFGAIAERRLSRKGDNPPCARRRSLTRMTVESGFGVEVAINAQLRTHPSRCASSSRLTTSGHRLI
jgi:hypothetical protein